MGSAHEDVSESTSALAVGLRDACDDARRRVWMERLRARLLPDLKSRVPADVADVAGRTAVCDSVLLRVYRRIQAGSIRKPRFAAYRNLKWWLGNWHDYRAAKKRGGDRIHVDLDETVMLEEKDTVSEYTAEERDRIFAEAKLTARELEAINRRTTEAVTWAEVAGSMGVSETRARTLYRKGLEKIRRRLL